MQALYFQPDTRSFQPGTYPDEPLPPGHALLRVARVGICGSDLHSIESGEMGGVAITTPYILGHEFSGTIEALAPDVRHGPPAVGDRVAVDPQLPCLRCPFCLHGRENICPHMAFVGGYPLHGALRERIALPLRNLFRLPDGLDLEQGVVAEPLCVALHAVRLAGPLLDASIAVIGAGPIGNLIVQCARLQTGGPLLVSEPIAERRALARRCGATEAVDPTAGSLDELRKRFPEGYGPDVVFEATREGEGLRAALELVRPGGTVVYVGIANDPVPIRTSPARRKEVTLQWVRRSRGGYPTALRLLAEGRIDGKALVTHRTGIERAEEAFRTVGGYRDGVVKALIEVCTE